MEALKKKLIHLAVVGLFLGGFSGGIPLMVAQSVEAAPSASQPEHSLVATAGNQPEVTELPDSPGAVQTANSPQQQASPSNSTPAQSTQKTNQSQTEPAPQKPVGTAAAEAPDASGIAASQPAGVAVSPAKQRRVRTLVLRMGAIIGAGVAVGSVVALTAATSSKPPGAH